MSLDNEKWDGNWEFIMCDLYWNWECKRINLFKVSTNIFPVFFWELGINWFWLLTYLIIWNREDTIQCSLTQFLNFIKAVRFSAKFEEQKFKHYEFHDFSGSSRRNHCIFNSWLQYKILLSIMVLKLIILTFAKFRTTLRLTYFSSKLIKFWQIPRTD